MKHRVMVKVCGITGAEDAPLQCPCRRSDILGFIMYDKSPRYVTPQKASGIAESCRRELQELPRFAGVFVNASIDFIAESAALIGLDYVQLHGDEDASFAMELRERLDKEGMSGVRIIKAVRVRNSGDVNSALQYPADYYLFDTFSRDVYGGTGMTFDWGLLDSFPEKSRLFLSGGLAPENASAAVEAVSPFALDLCSSLEMERGKKDKKKIDELFAVLVRS